MDNLNNKDKKMPIQQKSEVKVKSPVLEKISVVVMMLGSIALAAGLFTLPIVTKLIDSDKTITVNPALPDCADSDGRNAFRTQGTVTLTFDDGKDNSAIDHCLGVSRDIVIDYYCPLTSGEDVMVRGATIDENGVVTEEDESVSAPEFQYTQTSCSDRYGVGWGCKDGACEYTPSCGDGICNAEEQCNTCSTDCGVCVCGDGLCEGDETYDTCPQDCQSGAVCGNGIQENPESCDGEDLGGATCLSAVGVDGEGLSCTSECTFDVSACLLCSDAEDKNSGDINGDGKVDSSDVKYMIDYLYNDGSAPCEVADTYKTPESMTKDEVLEYLYSLQTNSPQLMPIKPSILEEAKEQGLTLNTAEEIEGSGINEPGPTLNMSTLEKGRDTGIFELTTLNALADFSDNTAKTPATYFDELLYSIDPTVHSLRNYYRDNSYNTLDIVPIIKPSEVTDGNTTGWLRMPHPYPYYVTGAGCETSTLCNGSYHSGTGCWPCNAQGLAKDIVTSLDDQIDFSQLDYDGDGVVNEVILTHAGRGAEEFSSPESYQYLWSIRWSIPDNFCAKDSRSHDWCDSDSDCIVSEIDYGPCIKNNTPILDGVQVKGFTLQPERVYANIGGNYQETTIKVGVYAHETGHMLGLPDLYDTDDSSYGVGKWSLMGYGNWLGPNDIGGTPANLDAWSRVKLGFVNPAQPVVLDNLPACINIPSASDSPYSVVKLSTNNQSSNEYFLAENRQKTGWDEFLPGRGLLIWHIDDDNLNYHKNNYEWWPGIKRCYGFRDVCTSDNNCNGGTCKIADPWAHYTVALEQADGRYELEHRNTLGDYHDPYIGKLFSAISTPNSNFYSGEQSQVAINNISSSQQTMTADMYVSINKSGSDGTCGDLNYDGTIDDDDLSALMDLVYGVK